MKDFTPNKFKQWYRSVLLLFCAVTITSVFTTNQAVAQERTRTTSKSMTVHLSQNEGLVVIDADGSSNAEAKLTIVNDADKVVYRKAVMLRGQRVSIHVPTAQLGAGNTFTARLVSPKFKAEQTFQLERKK